MSLVNLATQMCLPEIAQEQSWICHLWRRRKRRPVIRTNEALNLPACTVEQKAKSIAGKPARQLSTITSQLGCSDLQVMRNAGVVIRYARGQTRAGAAGT
jgi:hypothetical protein